MSQCTLGPTQCRASRNYILHVEERWRFRPSCSKTGGRTVIRERAIPLPAQFTKALAAVAIRQGDEKIGVGLLLGGFMDACHFKKIPLAVGNAAVWTVWFGSVRRQPSALLNRGWGVFLGGCPMNFRLRWLISYCGLGYVDLWSTKLFKF